MIHIESRNIDDLRVEHSFPTVEEMLSNWDSEDPDMGDNEILLVVMDGLVLYSSLGRKGGKYEDTVRTADIMAWFEQS